MLFIEPTSSRYAVPTDYPLLQENKCSKNQPSIHSAHLTATYQIGSLCREQMVICLLITDLYGDKDKNLVNDYERDPPLAATSQPPGPKQKKTGSVRSTSLSQFPVSELMPSLPTSSTRFPVCVAFCHFEVIQIT